MHKKLLRFLPDALKVGPVSFLLQRVSSGAFFKGSDVWTSKKEEAMEFSTLDNAIRFCVKEGIGDVQIVELGEGGQIKSRLQPFGKKEGRPPTEGRQRGGNG